MSDKQVRAQYTREFKREAVRQVRSGQAIAVVAKYWAFPKRAWATGCDCQPRVNWTVRAMVTRASKSRPSKWRLPGYVPRMPAFAWSATSQIKPRRTSRRTRCEVRLD